MKVLTLNSTTGKEIVAFLNRITENNSFSTEEFVCGVGDLDISEDRMMNLEWKNRMVHQPTLVSLDYDKEEDIVYSDYIRVPLGPYAYLRYLPKMSVFYVDENFIIAQITRNRVYCSKDDVSVFYRRYAVLE